MPRVDEYLKKSTFYIYTSEDEAQATSPISATGFFFSIPLNVNGALMIYAVTNRHVINKVGQNPVLRVNTKGDGFDVIRTKNDQWKFHQGGSDLAICALGMDNKFDYKTLHPEFFLKEEFMKENNVGSGDDIFMIGNFRGRSGNLKNLPTVRFGNIAQMPEEPLFNPHTKQDEESFLVEMRSISGCSGSPVFLSIPFGPPRKKHQVKEEKTKRKFKVVPDYTRLLGIDWGHLRTERKIFDRDNDAYEQYFYINNAMAGVVPSWKLEEMLFSEDEIKMRKKASEEIIK